jgi:uncharacterized protein YlxW (UPF0749 family)
MTSGYNTIGKPGYVDVVGDEVIDVDFRGNIPRLTIKAIAKTAADQLATEYPHRVYQTSVEVHNLNGEKVSEDCIYPRGWTDERSPGGMHRLVFCTKWYQPDSIADINQMIFGPDDESEASVRASDAMVKAAADLVLDGLEPNTLEYKLLKRRMELQQGIKLLRTNLAQLKREREEYLKNSDRQLKDIESDIAFFQAQQRGLEAEALPEEIEAVATEAAEVVDQG